MPQPLSRIASALAGDHRAFPIEHRLFNAISLLNAAANAGGALHHALFLPGYESLALLQLVTGLLFFLFYYLSRFRRVHRPLYWPFVLLMAGFLFANALGNAASGGGAHYYLIAGLVISVVLSGSARTSALAAAVFGAATAALLLIERHRPSWIARHATPDERFFDVTGNLLFVQIFTGAVVLILMKELDGERRESDRLLLNVMPESIARELKHTDRVRPLGYEDASVLFTDFVGFTQIAAGLTPPELIAELDECFRRFDLITRRHGLEKIKTIGDAYMAAGGVPAPNRTHAADCVRAALEIRDYVAGLKGERAAAGRPFWDVRIGVHTGPLVAGVVGREKFAYDVWGDTVNTASRMESSGEAGRVNISRATYERVKGLFECEPRGRVETKGKGLVEMFFVARARAQRPEGRGAQPPGESPRA